MRTEYVDIFQKYMGSGLIVILFLAALVYLFFTEKRKQVRILLIYIPALVLLVYFNPLFYGIFYRVAGSEIYFRILWLLPVVPVLAYTGVTIYDKARDRAKLPVLAACMAVILLCGKTVYANPLFTPAQNLYHVPNYVVHVCDAIEVEGREVKAVFPKEFLLYVRQYSPVVCMPYGRDGIIYQGNPFYNLMESETIDAALLAEYAKGTQCHYIVLQEEKALEGDLADYDYKVFGRMDGYVIYEDLTIYKGL